MHLSTLKFFSVFPFWVCLFFKSLFFKLQLYYLIYFILLCSKANLYGMVSSLCVGLHFLLIVSVGTSHNMCAKAKTRHIATLFFVFYSPPLLKQESQASITNRGSILLLSNR